MIRACRELEIESVAVYSQADESALHVRKADHAIDIGKAAARFSYLNPDVLIEAAQTSGADAIHPGYGFLSENADFAQRCHDAGLIWVGPPAEAIERMGDKAAARTVAAEAGVPIVPGTDGTVAPDQAVTAAEEIGYPVMLKAAAGGGGKGIRIARDKDELQDCVTVAAREARATFGDPALYLEKLLVSPRHVEIQVLADTHGNVIHLYERECSLQRRRQKLLEESPSPALDADTRERMAAGAARLATATGYTNAGTVEFLLDASGAFYFIEMNTRIQVEHPVTEMVTGIDLVKAQLRIAAGEPLAIAQEEISLHGAAIEFRINAEDPDSDFHPSPGQITRPRDPRRPGRPPRHRALHRLHGAALLRLAHREADRLGPRSSGGDFARTPRARGVHDRGNRHDDPVSPPDPRAPRVQTGRISHRLSQRPRACMKCDRALGPRQPHPAR